MIDLEIKKLDSFEISLAKELIEMFGFDDETEHFVFSSDEYIGQMLAREDFHVIVALDEGKLIGGLTAYEIKMFKRETTEMFLYEIEVAETHRQTGIGKALIEFLKKSAPKDKSSRCSSERRKKIFRRENYTLRLAESRTKIRFGLIIGFK